MKKDLLLHLQSLRGIAALIIVFHHLKSLSSNLAQNDFMANSSLAVDFFFVLSGFATMFPSFGFYGSLTWGAQVALVSITTKVLINKKIRYI